MDRLSRVIAGASLAIVLGIVGSSAGCRNTRNDVPAGKPYSATGGTPPTVGFNSDPHPSTSIGPGLYGNAPAQPNSMDPNVGAAGSGAGAALHLNMARRIRLQVPMARPPRTVTVPRQRRHPEPISDVVVNFARRCGPGRVKSG